MDEIHQDKTGSQPTAAKAEPSQPPSSPENNKKPGRLQQVRKKASQPLIFVGICVAFVGILALIYLWFRFNWTGWLLLLFILIGILLLILLIQAGYTAQGTGFKDRKLWHWMKLLFQAIAAVAIPLSIIVGLIQFNTQQSASADMQATQVAAARTQTVDQQDEITLLTYLGDMSDLLLNRKLLKSNPGDEVRQLARERTLTTLRRLDAGRNRIVLQFLRDEHLIGIQDAVINLSYADLSNAYLSGTDLSGTDLSGTNLSGAHLNGVNLNGTHLNNATMNKADLSNAFLNDAILSGAILNSATLSGAILNSATLSGAILNHAILRATILNHADLSGADLSYATLNNADLNGANLSYAILNDAHLYGADVSDATLSYASFNQPQLDTVYSCANADLGYTRLKCNRSGSIVTLTYWYTESPAETPVILHLIQQFEQQHHNIKINPVYKPFLQARAAFINASEAGNAPDVLRSDIGWVTQFASQYYLLDIDSYVSQNDRSDYLSAPLSYDQYNGHLYGLPQVTDFLALLYNRTELAKVGITTSSALATMDAFETAAMKVVQSNAPKYGFETNGQSYYVLPFLWAFGGGMIDQHNNILVNNAGSVAGLNFLLKLQNIYKVMPAQVDFSNGTANMVNDFKSGKTAMIFDGPWDVSNILTGSAFSNPGNLGIAAVPIGPAGQTGSPAGGQSYVISADTAHPTEAFQFISFMSSRDSQVAIAEENHTLPTRNSAYQELGYDNFLCNFPDRGVSLDPLISFHCIQSTARDRPAIPQGGYLFDAFDPNIRAALDSTKSPTDALNAVADAWKQLLASP